jgi:fructose-1,6-bisphosphate aldolase class II
MPLVTSKEILEDARKRGYAVGAFNANNLEYVQAIIEAAEEERAPVILQASQGAIKYAGLNHIVAMVKASAEKATVPVVLHLDHGTDFIQNVRCLRAGFTSLMFDGSSLSFEENVAITKKVGEIAHACGVPVEAELGKVPQSGQVTEEDVKALMTDPEEAQKFVELTGVDSLAVAVGSVHAMRQQAAKLDIERISRISELVGIPLVLHGGTGVTDEGYKEAIPAGICKINIATELNKACMVAVKEAIAKDPDVIDLRKVLRPARDAIKETVKTKMRVFGASGKA